MPSKVCTGCGEDKDFALFNKNAKKKDGLQTWCRDCTKLKNNATYLSSESHRKRIKENNARTVSENKDFVRMLKSSGCLCCSENDPVALDFHHLDEKTKDGNVSDLFRYGKKKLMREIEKCVILCANCHRKVHAGVISLPERKEEGPSW